MAAPYVHDTITATGTAATSLSIDLSTLAISDKHSKLVVLLTFKTSSHVTTPTVNGGSDSLARFAWHAASLEQAEMWFGDYIGAATEAGNLTFAWTGAHDVVCVAFCIEAGGKQVYFESFNYGSATASTFDADAINLDGGEQLILEAVATNAATLTTVTAPTGFPDHTYGPYTANSAVSVLAIDNDAGSVTSFNPTTWTTSTNGTQGNLVGMTLGFSAYTSPTNDDIANAITMYLPAGRMAGVYSGAYLQSNSEYDDSWWWQGRTVWYTFTGKGGGWTIEVLGSTVSYDFGTTPFEAGGYFALYEASVGETNATTIYTGRIAPTSETFSGGANGDRNYSATFASLDNTKQYWVQVDSTYAITTGTFTLTWTPTTGTSASQTPLATGTGQGFAPVISTPSNATVTVPSTPNGSAQALVPTVTAIRNVTVTPTVAAGTGQALVGYLMLHGYPSGYSPGAGGTPQGVGDFWTITITAADG